MLLYLDHAHLLASLALEAMGTGSLGLSHSALTLLLLI